MEVGNLVEDLLVAAQATIGRVNVVPEPIRLGSELADLVGLLDLPNPPSIDVIGDIAGIDPACTLGPMSAPPPAGPIR